MGDYASASDAMEAWLSSANAAAAVGAALKSAMAREGGGSNGRNLSFDHLVAVCGAAVEQLPTELAALIPVPDEAFVTKCIEKTLPDVLKSGIRDEEALTVAVQAVLMNLAASVDVMCAALTAQERREAEGES